MKNLSKRLKIIIGVVSLLLISAGVYFATTLSSTPTIRGIEDQVVEYGEAIDISFDTIIDTSNLSDEEITKVKESFELTNPITNEEGKDYPAIGEYEVSYKSDYGEGEITYTVEDTVSPVITLTDGAKDLEIPYETDLNTKMFYEVSDLSPTTESEEGEVVTTELGEHVITITSTDESGNVSDPVELKYTVVDETAPELTLSESTLEVEIAEEIDFSKLVSSATDDVDGDLIGNVTLPETTSYDEAGSYEAKISVSDSSENVTTKTITITVIDPNATTADNSSTETGTDTSDSETSTSGSSTVVTGNGKGGVVVIDAGHQTTANLGQEAIGPGSSETKYKVTGGATGNTTGYTEYQLNLDLALKLEKILEAQGYTVIQVRTTNNVNISNKERAMIANNYPSSVFIRIHADSSTNTSAKGVSGLCQSSSNPYHPGLYSASYSLTKYVVNGICETTGANNRGIIATDQISGINWSNVPTALVEVGFLSNPSEEALLVTSSYQDKIAQGMANGIIRYISS